MPNAYISDAADAPGITSAASGEIVVQTGLFDASTLATSGTSGVAIGIGDTIDIVKLPANTELDDLIVDSDILDTNGTPLVAFEVGLYDNGFTAYGTADTSAPGVYIAATTIGQTGVNIARLTTKAARRILAVPYDRYIRIQFTAGPATPSAVSASIKVSAFTRNKNRSAV